MCVEAASGPTDLVAERPLHTAAAVLAGSPEHRCPWGHIWGQTRCLAAPSLGKHRHSMIRASCCPFHDCVRPVFFLGDLRSHMKE